MNWYKIAQITSISQQDAFNRKMFGPVFHGTSSNNKQKIDAEGFKIFIGNERSQNISHGYENTQYGATGNIPPIHHLGFGIYFTTNKSIAKGFNNQTTSGLDTYFLDVPNLEIINFGSPNTMMKWWIQNGYDPNLAIKDRVKATQILTDNLKSKYDAVWYKGKGLYRLLDGDQICVYDTSKIYKIDKKLNKPGEIGSKVIRLTDNMKGVLLNRRPIKEEYKQFHNNENEFLDVKWQKGGRDYNVYPSQVSFAQSNNLNKYSQEKLNLSSIIQKWRDQGITLDVWENNRKNLILLDKIIVPKERRKQGIGSQILQELTNYADSVGKRIELSLAVKGDNFGTTSRGRLVDFYSRFGFKENKGKNKDYSTMSSMYRNNPISDKKSNTDKIFFKGATMISGIQDIIYHVSNILKNKISDYPGISYVVKGKTDNAFYLKFTDEDKNIFNVNMMDNNGKLMVNVLKNARSSLFSIYEDIDKIDIYNLTIEILGAIYNSQYYKQ